MTSEALDRYQAFQQQTDESNFGSSVNTAAEQKLSLINNTYEYTTQCNM